MGEIDSAEVVDVLRSISDRGAADIAKRALQTTSAVFRYAQAHKIPGVTHNPCASFKPWKEVNKGRGLDPCLLASLLRGFGIKPDRIGRDEHNKQQRGYKCSWFEDAWARYCAVPRRPCEVLSFSHSQRVDLLLASQQVHTLH